MIPNHHYKKSQSSAGVNINTPNYSSAIPVILFTTTSERAELTQVVMATQCAMCDHLCTE